MHNGNRAKRVLNGFSAADLVSITKLSLHTVNYLAREGYLRPTYAKGTVRGRVRYYSYRDLVVARIIQKLTATGLELKRLKRAIRLLSQDATWESTGQLHLLATDGRQVFYHLKNGSLLELKPNLQQSFAFVLDVARTRSETRQLIDEKRRRRFALENHPLIFEQPTRKLRSADR
jgi:DNA-binding transcriptional MerR regulator